MGVNRDTTAEREAAVRKALEEKPMTVRGLMERTGMSLNSCRNFVTNLRRGKKVHVSGWGLEGHTKYAIFALGDFPDAVFVPQTKEEKSRKHAEWRKRVGPCPRGRNPLDAVAEAKKDIVRRHQQDMANWVPHPDPAAAWMFGAANAEIAEAA